MSYFLQATFNHFSIHSSYNRIPSLVNHSIIPSKGDLAIALLKIQLSEPEPKPFRISSMSSSVFKNGCSELPIQIKMTFKLLGHISLHLKKFYFSWCPYFFPISFLFISSLPPFLPSFSVFICWPHKLILGPGGCVWGWGARLHWESPTTEVLETKKA